MNKGKIPFKYCQIIGNGLGILFYDTVLCYVKYWPTGIMVLMLVCWVRILQK